MLGSSSRLLAARSLIRRGCGSRAASMAASPSLQLVPCDAQPQYAFGPWPIGAGEVFARSETAYAFVNLKPLVPGHVLVSPLRAARRLRDLRPEEVCGVMLLAQAVADRLERHYGAAAVTLAVQDGEAAGQTVPHVHVHVLPRRAGDFEPNDAVYGALEEGERGMAGGLERHTANGGGGGSGGGSGAAAAPAERLNLDVERKPRTREEMAAEAFTLRALFYDELQKQ
ncbi:hypothetical protein Rsub_07880 [Raphidocelis subcapitata]|uniref:Bis(5'-adenosyl)-triphosphatase n=1 Tax=Raphidocelis subcapitata TaxID=307507 RepID=A0A2V0PDC2_9CHLO|nr:hypothetical protein Rsub_07880 [Raphidocelis subcapitata]|eukprot:GBF95167.1 hypothetical protein Rsub_07880 [Raphidocelis subcapitata]